VAYACGISSSGSGFVIAEDRVVTNAHVVAGVDRPVVELPGREARDGQVVYFDPVDDIAVIAVDDLEADPLEVAPVLPAGSSAAVQGYPHGGPFESMSAAVLAVGIVPVPDIYDDSSHPREIYTLDANVRPGNSGGPLFNLQGEVIGVLGPNGIGKTTFVKLLAGLEKPDEGVHDLKLRVSYKPQYLQAGQGITVEDSFENAKIDAQVFEREIDKKLNIRALYDKKLSELSGGELQKVAVSLCLSRNDADLFLLDEPSAFIDVEDRLNVAEIIKDFVRLFVLINIILVKKIWKI